jgi:uncharacterized protein YecE (DUF72 family)
MARSAPASGCQVSSHSIGGSGRSLEIAVTKSSKPGIFRPMAGAIRIGCSGWQYRSWREVLYPHGLAQRRWLARYAEVFETVEVNSTFYRLARPAAVARWVAETPAAFRFTVKASRYLTHIKRLHEMRTGIGRFSDAIAPLAESGRLECVLWQLPGTQQRDDARLAEALAALPPGRHAFEFRHPSWFAEDVLEALRAHGVALVIGDHPERPWQPYTVTAPFSLVRLHYGAAGRRGNYSERELAAWARRLRRLAQDTDEVLVYLNNDWEGFAVRNARRLQALLGQAPRS